MGVLQKFIDWLMSLFGAKKEPAQLTSGQKAQIQHNAIRGLEDVEGAEHIKVHGTGDGSRVIKQCDGAALVEDDGEQQWVDQVNKEFPRERWNDEWGPLGNQPDPDERLAEFFFHEKTFDMARSGDPLDGERKLLAFGYRDVGHFFKVRATILKHFGTPHGPNLDDSVFDSQRVMNAGMKAASKMHGATMQATVNANPELLAPVEGITVELYAQIQARVAQQIPQDQLLQLLAQHNLDFPTWERASNVWNDRMSKDTTATIATIYGQAFMNSGQGQFGAAGQAVGSKAWDGSAAGGAEPISFETFCEISGAQSAWSKTGKDVNALLKSQFNMVAADWAQASTWWFSQLTANLSRFDEYNRKMEHYEQKHMGPVQKFDQDISF